MEPYLFSLYIACIIITSLSVAEFCEISNLIVLPLAAHSVSSLKLDGVCYRIPTAA